MSCANCLSDLADGTCLACVLESESSDATRDATWLRGLVEQLTVRGDVRGVVVAMEEKIEALLRRARECDEEVDDYRAEEEKRRR